MEVYLKIQIFLPIVLGVDLILKIPSNSYLSDDLFRFGSSSIAKFLISKFLNKFSNIRPLKALSELF
jgi:hypothetical protein